MEDRSKKGVDSSIISTVLVLGVFLLLSLQYFRITPEDSHQNQVLINQSSNDIEYVPTDTKPISVDPTLPPNQSPASITTATKTTGRLDFSDIDTNARQTLVNILCTSNKLRSITGSGVIIDDRGVILTNAHIGQYLLLQNTLGKGVVDCVVRLGNPAKALYRAELLYLSPNWVRNNYKTIVETDPFGTGEDDFALLYITHPIDSRITLPEYFPTIAIDTSDSIIKPGEQVLVLGYPAGLLGNIGNNQNIYIATSVVNVGRAFTFKEDTFDLFSISGTLVSQKGSSGGGVVNQVNGKLSGLIVTTSEEKSVNDRELRAITLSHIDRSMKSQEGLGIGEFLQGELANKNRWFYQNRADELSRLLVGMLDKK